MGFWSFMLDMLVFDWLFEDFDDDLDSGMFNDNF